MGKTLAEMALCGFAALGIFGSPYVGAQPAVPAAQDLQPPQAPGQKSPIPSDTEIKLAEKEIREVYKDEYKITDPAKKKAFADKLLTNGRAATNNAQKYVLLREASNTLADLLELNNAHDAVKAMRDNFDSFNSLDTYDKLLSAAQKKTKTKEDAGKVAEAYMQLADNAVGDKNYKIALSSAKSAETIGKKAGDASLVDKAGDLIKAIPEIEKEYSIVKKAEDTLKLNPNDPEANTIVGKYLAFVDNDWDAALKLLSKGSNGVSKAAEQEITLRSGGSDNPESIAQVADLWYEQSNKITNVLDKKRFATHAFELYQQAQPKATGLTKDKIDKRISELEKKVSSEIDITTITPQSVIAGWGKLFINEDLISKNTKRTLRVNGTPCNNYLLIHAPSTITYKIPPKTRLFSAIGASYETEESGKPIEGSFKYIILIDGNKVYESKPLSSYPNHEVSIKIRIPLQSNEIQLKIDDLGNKDADHSIWAYPRFFQ